MSHGALEVLAYHPQGVAVQQEVHDPGVQEAGTHEDPWHGEHAIRAEDREAFDESAGDGLPQEREAAQPQQHVGDDGSRRADACPHGVARSCRSLAAGELTVAVHAAHADGGGPLAFRAGGPVAALAAHIAHPIRVPWASGLG